MSSNDREDIRGQLQGIGRKLFRKEALEDDTGGTGAGPAPPPLTGPFAPGGPPSGTSSTPFPPRRLPVLRLAGHSLGPETKGNDVNFVVQLLEDLLGECRRLGVDNKKLKTRLQAAQAELQTSQAELARLQLAGETRASAEEEWRHRVWELELQVLLLHEEVLHLTEARQGTERLREHLEGAVGAHQRENDELAAKAAGLERDLRLLQKILAREVAELLAKVDQLNDENDALHRRLAETPPAPAAAAPTPGDAPPVDLVPGLETEDDDLDFDELFRQLQPQAVPPSDGHNPKMEAETLRANLAHANRTIARLRHQVVKQRKETPVVETEKAPLLPRKARQRRLGHFGSGPSGPAAAKRGLSPLKRELLVVDATSAPGGDWEDFLDLQHPENHKVGQENQRVGQENHRGSQPGAGFERGFKRGSRLAGSLAGSLEGSGLDTLFEFGGDEAPGFVHVEDLSDEDDGALREAAALFTNQLRRQASQKKIDAYVSERNLVMIPYDEYQQLTGAAKTPSVELALAAATQAGYHVLLAQQFAELSDDTAAVARAKRAGYSVLLPEEYAQLVSEKEMERRLRAKGLVVVPEAELEGKREKERGEREVEQSERKREMEHTVAEHTRQMDAAHQREQERATALEQAQAELVSTKSVLDTTRSELDTTATALTTAKSELDTTRSELGTTKTELGTTKAELEKATAELELASTQLANPSPDLVRDMAQRLHLVVLAQDEAHALQQPSLDTLTHRARAHKHQLVADERLVELETPLLALVRSRATALNHTVIPQAEHARLTQPTLDDVKDSASRLGQVVVPEAEHQRLVAPVLEDQLKVRADELGLLTMTRPEYTKLWERANDPSREQLEQAAAKHSAVVVSSDEHARLALPGPDEVREHLKRHGLAVLPELEVQHLREAAQRTLRDHAQAEGMVAVPKDEYEMLRLPSLERVKKLATTAGFVPVAKDAYLELVKPKAERVRELAAGHGLVTVPEEEHRGLVLPGAEQVHEHARRHGLVTVPHEQHKQLVEPSKEQVVELAAGHGLVAVPQTEHKLLVEPSKQRVVDLALAQGFVAVPADEHKQLVQPSPEAVEKHAAAHGLKVVPEAAYHELTQPLKEAVEAHAATHGLATVDKDTLRQLEAPSPEQLAQKAQDKGLVVVPADEHRLLVQPLADQVREHLSRLGLVTVAQDEYLLLVEPPKEKVVAEAAKHGLVAVPEAEHKLLVEPLKERVVDLALAQGFVAVPADEHQQLVAPPKEQVGKLAQAHGLVTVPKDKYALLLKPSKEKVAELALGYGLVTLAKEDHAQLEQPPKERVIEHAKAHGLVPLEREQHQQLVEPPKDRVKQLALGHGLVTVGKDSYLVLLQPPKEKVEQHAKQHGLVTMSEDEHQQLKAPLKQQVADMAKKHGLVAVDEHEHRALVQPPKDTVQQHAKAHGLVTLSPDEYRQLKLPTVAELEQHAEQHQMKLVPKKELAVLTQLAKAPSLSLVKRHAEQHHHTVVANDELDQLRNPLADAVSKHAQTHGLTTLATPEYHALKTRADQPTQKQVQEAAATVGLVALPQHKHDEMVARLTKPLVADLQQQAKDLHGHELVPEEHLRALREPEVADLEALAAAHGHVVVPQKDWHHRELAAWVQAQAPKHGQVVLSQDEHRALTKPLVTAVTEMAAAHGLVAVPQADWTLLRAQVESPLLAWLRDHLAKHDYTAVAASDYARLISPENMLQQGLVMVPQREYDAYKHRAEHPLPEEVRQLATALGCTVVPVAEWEAVRLRAEHPLEEAVKLRATALGWAVVASGELAELRRQVAAPSVDYLAEHAASKDMVVVSKLEWTKPSVERVKQAAQAHDMAVVNKEEYLAMLRRQHAPELEFLAKKAREQGQVVVPEADYDALVNPLAETVSQHAARHGQVVLAVADHRLREEQHQQLAEKHSLLAEERKLLEQARNQAEEEHQRLVDEHQSLAAQHRELEEQNSTLQARFAKLEGEHAQATENLSRGKSDAEELAKSHLAAQLKLEVVTREKDEALARLEQAQAEMERLRADHEAVGEQHKLVVASAESERATSASELTGLKLELAAMAAKHEAAQSKVQELEREHKQLGDEHERVVAEIGRLETEKKQAEDARDAHEQQVVQKETEAEQARAKHAEIERAHTELCEKHREVAADLELLRGHHKSLEREHAETAKAHRALQESHGKLEEKQRGLESDHHALTEQHQALAHDHQALTEQHTTLSGKHTTLEDSHRELAEQHQLLSDKHGTAAGIAAAAAALGLVAVSRDDHEALQKQAQMPLEEAAKQSQKKIVSDEEYAAIMARLEQAEKARAEAEKARDDAKAAAQTVTESSSSRLKQTQATLDETEAKLEETKAALALTQASLDEAATTLKVRDNELAKLNGPEMVVLTAAEHARLQLVDGLKAAADKHNMAIVELADLARLKKRALETLEDRARAAEMRLVPAQDYDEMVVKATKPSLTDITSHAAEFGMAVIAVGDYKALKEVADKPITQRASEHGYVAIPKAEFELLLTRFDHPSLEYLTLKAKEHKFAMIPEAEWLLTKTEADRDIKAKAAEAGMVAVAAGEWDRLHRDSQKDARVRAKEAGLVVMSPDEADRLRAEASKDVHARAKEQGLVAVAHDHYHQLQADAAKDVHDRARELKMVVMGEDEAQQLRDDAAKDVWARARELKLVVLSEAEAQRFKRFLARQLMALVATGSTHDEFEDAQADFDVASSDASSEKELRAKARELGLVVLSQDEAQALAGNDTTEIGNRTLEATDLVDTLDAELPQSSTPKRTLVASRSSVVVIPRLELDELKGHPSRERVAEQAKQLGLVVLLKLEYQRLQGLTDKWTSSPAVVAAARKLGLLAVPELAFIPTTVQRIPDLANVTLVPTLYYNKLLRNDGLCIEKVSDETFRKYAERRGYQVAGSSLHPGGPVSSPGGFALAQLTPGSTPVKSQITPIMEQRPAMESQLSEQKFTPPPMVRKNTLTTPSSLGLLRFLPALELVRLALLMRADSVATNGVFSMATTASMTDRLMIPAITQVVIGEYCFKYYRRLGPLLLLSEARHERYFWVHPYSLTLYWLRQNPVLLNPLEIKTRAAAILDVKLVDDNNPYPTGLYHKLIIVYSHDRLVKITCPSRQRHNIWYNALRYLIHRNMEDLSFDRGDMDDFAAHLIEDEEENEEANNTVEQLQKRHEILLDIGERHSFPRSKLTRSSPRKHKLMLH